jgi:uncharacterized protein
LTEVPPSVDRPPLVVVQPTSLCNIDCSYCYVEGRSDPRQMTRATLTRIAQSVAARFSGAEADVVFHSGEPLTAGMRWFSDAVAAFTEAGRNHECVINFGVQTNGVLVRDAWAEFFREHDFMVGVSLDGPADIHDRYRTTRTGRGSHARTVAGIACLQEHGLEVSVLAVVTPASFGRAEDIYAHFKRLNIRRVGFNPDDTTGVRTSTLAADQQSVRGYEQFLRTLVRLVAADPEPVRIREIVQMTRHILDAARGERELVPDVVMPWRVITFDRDGYFGTFSPEIMSAPARLRAPYVLGNVAQTAMSSPTVLRRTERIAREVQTGVDRCRATCRFFPVCGGGTPSSKLFELGTAAGTETNSCRLAVQALANAITQSIEDDQPARSSTCPSSG